MSQNRAVIQYMEAHGQITQEDAKDELGVSRLAARINDIRNGRGVEPRKVLSRTIRVRNRQGEDCDVAAYWLEKSPQVHYLLSQEGFMVKAPCNAEGVLSSLFVRETERITCPGCLAYLDERCTANRAFADQYQEVSNG